MLRLTSQILQAKDQKPYWLAETFNTIQKEGLLVMSHADKDQQKDLSAEELEAQEASELPDRENMSLVNANLAIPVNAAVAANVLSDGSTAYADAVQQTPIDQGNLGTVGQG